MSEEPSTDPMSVEQALQASERHLRAILETAVEGILTIDHHGIVESVNPAAAKLFGFNREEILGRNVKLLMPSPYFEEHDGYLENYLRTHVPKIIGTGREVQGLRKDGTTFPLHLSVSEVRLPDRVVFTGFVQDLTERNKAREMLERRVEERTVELCQTNEQLEELLYVMSHDVRTPLRGLRNYIDFLTDDLEGKLDSQSADDLDHVRRAARELSQMFEELLRYSRIGRDVGSPEAIDVGNIIEDITLGLGRELGQHVVIDGELPSLRGFPATIRQVFQNLIENGLRYNQASLPQVHISARPLSQQIGRWLFTVRDNGIGIEPQYHDQIFRMFTRLHANDQYEGTGIGLASVRKTLLQFGGDIRLESALGQGTTFFVELAEDSRPKNAKP